MNNTGIILLTIVWFLGLIVPTIWIQFGKEKEKGQRFGLATLYFLIYLIISLLLIKIFT